MLSRQIEFAGARCLVEVSPEREVFVARASLVEHDGAIVRPLVRPNRRHILAESDTPDAAMHAAIHYLERRFGPAARPEQAHGLGEATIGTPVALAE
jgi:hypothetical protein